MHLGGQRTNPGGPAWLRTSRGEGENIVDGPGPPVFSAGDEATHERNCGGSPLGMLPVESADERRDNAGTTFLDARELAGGAIRPTPATDNFHDVDQVGVVAFHRDRPVGHVNSDRPFTSTGTSTGTGTASHGTRNARLHRFAGVRFSSARRQHNDKTPRAHTHG